MRRQRVFSKNAVCETNARIRGMCFPSCQHFGETDHVLMGMRVSFEEAVNRGWIDPAEVPKSARKGPAHRERPDAKRRTSSQNPQDVLFRALARRLGYEAVRSEVEGLIPGRRYRADIYLPESRVVVEFDGFQYHRSKQAFQKDRERQNLFVQHGYRVLRFFNRQVHTDLDRVVEMIVSAHMG